MATLSKKLPQKLIFLRLWVLRYNIDQLRDVFEILFPFHSSSQLSSRTRKKRQLEPRRTKWERSKVGQERTVQASAHCSAVQTNHHTANDIRGSSSVIGQDRIFANDLAIGNGDSCSAYGAKQSLPHYSLWFDPSLHLRSCCRVVNEYVA